MVARCDLFFDQLETLWVLHYIISSQPKWVGWNRLMNQAFPENDTLSRQHALSYYADLASPRFSQNTFDKKLPDEISVALNAYTDQKFARLRLIEKLPGGDYAKEEPVAMPP